MKNRTLSLISIALTLISVTIAAASLKLRLDEIHSDKAVESETTQSVFTETDDTVS